MFAKKGFRLTLLIIAIIGVVIGVVYALDFLGIINVSSMASNVPIVGQYFKDKKSNGDKTVTAKQDNEQIKILMDANQKLADDNKNLNTKLASLNDKLSKLTTEKTDLENKLTAETSKTQQANDPNQQNLDDAKYRKLANYYSLMKADAAVKILNELDDSLVLEILNRVDPDQTAKILSKMDPKKAADLSKLMAN